MLRTVWFQHRAFGVVLWFLPGLPCVLLAACSEPATSQCPDGDDQPGGVCHVVPKSVCGLTRIHVDECSAITYPDNPPAGGNHYPVWAAYQTYSFAVPRGFWVHDLEHGAVVYSYNCADGCPDEVADVQGLIDALPIDEGCMADEPRRVVLTPDPLLDVRWGVSSWGHTLRADCVDDERFRQFYLNHFGQGPEAVCGDGSDFNGAPPCQ
jgi:Protein of unknown function (DUF3105)